MMEAGGPRIHAKSAGEAAVHNIAVPCTTMQYHVQHCAVITETQCIALYTHCTGQKLDVPSQTIQGTVGAFTMPVVLY